jgi:hypothetical protein
VTRENPPESRGSRGGEQTGTVDWDALGFGCREPFFKSTLKARKKTNKQVTRAA